MALATKSRTRKPSPAEKKARQSLSDVAYEELKHRIITLQYEPGSYLNEAMLSDDLEIGRTPVHHAVRRLTHEGLIEMIPRKGLIVKPISLQEVSEIIDVRLVNEIYCAEQACRKMTGTTAQDLRDILDRAEQFAQDDDIQSQMMLDREFHEKIAQTAGNQVLADILRNLHERSMRIWFVSLNNSTHADRVRSDHRVIVDALESGNPAQAGEAMRDHILAFKRNIGNLL